MNNQQIKYELTDICSRSFTLSLLLSLSLYIYIYIYIISDWRYKKEDSLQN